LLLCGSLIQWCIGAAPDGPYSDFICITQRNRGGKAQRWGGLVYQFIACAITMAGFGQKPS